MCNKSSRRVQLHGRTLKRIPSFPLKIHVSRGKGVSVELFFMFKVSHKVSWKLRRTNLDFGVGGFQPSIKWHTTATTAAVQALISYSPLYFEGFFLRKLHYVIQETRLIQKRRMPFRHKQKKISKDVYFWWCFLQFFKASCCFFRQTKTFALFLCELSLCLLFSPLPFSIPSAWRRIVSFAFYIITFVLFCGGQDVLNPPHQLLAW